MNKDNRLKQIEIELAYLRKIIEEFIEDKRVEIHYHYYYDYEGIKKFLREINEFDNYEE